MQYNQKTQTWILMMMFKEQKNTKLYQVTELTWHQVTSIWEKRMDEEIDFLKKKSNSKDFVWIGA